MIKTNYAIIHFIFVFACSLHPDGTLRGIDNHSIMATESEIIKNQKILLEAKYPNGLPETAKGSVVFDGIVKSAKRTKEGISLTEFHISKLLYGTLEGDKKIIDIYSPPIEKGGINFKKGEIYRVFTIKLDGVYRTWNWTGTVRILEEYEGR